MATTRLSLMLPGAVSLGAYEGGALAALLVAVRKAEGQLVVDSIASASAGSITAVVASRSLLSGADPVALMTATWVDLPALEKLRTSDAVSPLSMAKLKAAATSILGAVDIPDGGPGTYRQAEPVRLSMALTALGGLTYEVVSLRPEGEDERVRTASATTHTDWFNVTLPAGSDTEPDYLGAVDGALASGSTPVGFPPLLLDRRADADDYRRAGVVNGTDDWRIWYSDGGALDNEPFGRLLDLVDDITTNDDRVIFLLDTEPSTPRWGGKWFEAAVPTWTSTLRRVGKVRSSQNYYEDLRRLEKTNTHLKWVQAAADRLERAFAALAAGLPDDESHRLDAARAELLEAAAAIDADRAQIAAARRRDAAAQPDRTEAPSVLELLQLATGLQGKQRVVVEIVSPDIDPTDRRPAAEQLAGEFLFHFGGFFDVRYRQSDFALGYRNTTTWLTGWLPGHVEDADAVLAEVHARYDALGWDAVRTGGASPWQLRLKEKVDGARLVAQVAKVAVTGLLRDWRSR